MTTTSKVVKTDQELNPEKYFISPIGHIRDRIIIHESLDIPKEGLFISLNGFPFLAKPGIPIDIPRPVRQMIDTRIKTETSQDDGGIDHKRNIPRVTYTLLESDVDNPEKKAAAGANVPGAQASVPGLTASP